MVLYKYRRQPPSSLLGALLAGILGLVGRGKGLGLDRDCSLTRWVSKGVFTSIHSPLFIQSIFLSTYDILSTVANTRDQKSLKIKMQSLCSHGSCTQWGG